MKIKNCIRAISSCFKLCSIGKYRTPFYFNNDDSFSTVFSGIITFLCVGFLIVYASFVLSDIFDRDHTNFVLTANSLEFSIFDGIDLKGRSVCLNKKGCL